MRAGMLKYTLAHVNLVEISWEVEYLAEGQYVGKCDEVCIGQFVLTARIQYHNIQFSIFNIQTQNEFGLTSGQKPLTSSPAQVLHHIQIHHPPVPVYHCLDSLLLDSSFLATTKAHFPTLSTPHIHQP